MEIYFHASWTLNYPTGKADDENLFFKDDDTHVFIETKNSVAIIKTINVFI
jgi:hypothetical protein